jgi:hypothetical protein
MATADSSGPTGNWRRMHLGRNEEPKQKHRTWLGALWHLARHNRKHQAVADLMQVYPCWFTDENTFGRKHYHIGHRLGSARALRFPDKPRPGKLYVGVFSVEGGFQVREFSTCPAICFPLRPSVREALACYDMHGTKSNNPITTTTGK